MAGESQFDLWAQNKQTSAFESDSMKLVRSAGVQESLLRERNQALSSLTMQTGQQTAALESLSMQTAQQTAAMQSAARDQTFAVEGVRDAVDQLSFEIGAGLKALGALFDWRMQTTIALLEEQGRTQKEIEHLLRYPRLTEAEEMKERARKSYYKAIESASSQPQWHDQYLADAMRDFSAAADKNPQDFTLPLDIGRILLLEQNQPGSALRYLDDAARHAHMESDEWEAKAFFLAARAHEELGDLQAAYTSARRAVELDQSTLIYAYECARYCALTNRADECAQHLERTLRAVPIGGTVSADEAKVWWAKISAEDDFDAARDAIKVLFARLTKEANDAVKRALSKADLGLDTAEKAGELIKKAISSYQRVIDLVS